jgi:hypothetical protein
MGQWARQTVGSPIARSERPVGSVGATTVSAVAST